MSITHSCVQCHVGKCVCCTVLCAMSCGEMFLLYSAVCHSLADEEIFFLKNHNLVHDQLINHPIIK